MPLTRVVIVVDLHRRAEGCAAVRAAGEHHVGGAPARWLNACQHVDVIVCGGAGMVHCKETLPIQPARVDPAAEKVAAHVDRDVLIKDWRLVPELRITRTGAPKIESFAAYIEIAVTIHIKRSVYGLVRNIDLCPPSDSGIGRTIEYPAVATSLVVRLILEVVSRATGLINGEPLFVAPDRPLLAGNQRPGRATVCRTPYIGAEKGESVRPETIIEENARLIRGGYWIAAEEARLQHARKRPGQSSVGRISITGLAEIRGNIIELPPADSHSQGVGRVNCNGWFVRGVTNDVIAAGIDVHLVTGERTERRDDAWRCLDLPRWRCRVIVFL